jgi:GxxExxY protein
MAGPSDAEWPMHAEEMGALTEKVIGCAYAVSNELGCGFLGKVYENALALELRNAGLDVKQQWPLAVLYRGDLVGEYTADILVGNCILIELKAAKKLDDIHLAQCLNYLKAAGLKLCLLLNFGQPKVEVKRVVRRL